MKIYNHSEFNLTKKRAAITDEERRLIDEAIAEGRVQRIPERTSGMDDELVWEGDPNRHGIGRLVLKNPRTRAETLQRHKNKMFNRNRPEYARITQRRAEVARLTRQGMLIRDIAATLGISISMVKNDREYLRKTGKLEGRGGK